MRRLWRAERGGIDSTLLAAGLLLTFMLCIRLIWPLWHLFSLRAELARSLHMANRAAVGAFDYSEWTQTQTLVLTDATARLWDSLTVSLALDENGWLPPPQPLVSGPVQIDVALEPAPAAGDLWASRATLTLPVTAFGQEWTLRLEDVHYLHVRE